jgi:hypothetical protein
MLAKLRPASRWVKDPPDVACDRRIGFEAVRRRPHVVWARLGVWVGIHELVAVGRPATEVPALQLGLGVHGRGGAVPGTGACARAGWAGTPESSPHVGVGDVQAIAAPPPMA